VFGFSAVISTMEINSIDSLIWNLCYFYGYFTKLYDLLPETFTLAAPYRRMVVLKIFLWMILKRHY